MSREEIKKLEEKILKNKRLYYLGKPEISDIEYDRIEGALKKIDPNNEVLKIVGSDFFSSEKIEHATKMLSLNKTYKIDELASWAGNNKIISTFKIDGSSCSLIYRDGLLKLAKTRGDGKFGENITEKVYNIPHIPKSVSSVGDIEVRGEVYCTEESFIKISNAMVELGLEKPNSQRNIVAGLLGRKENIELSKHLSFQAFELMGEGLPFKTEEDKFKNLIDLGFETPEYFVNKSRKDFDERITEAQAFMNEGEYLIDGIVFTFDDIQMHQELGETAHHPRYKIAFKFQGDTKTSTIESISWQVSRNGILTPVGNIVPVELSGAMVSRVTLHNYGMVKQFNLKTGDEIEIVRSGEVIPKFLNVIKESNNKFSYPNECPSCNEEVFVENIRLVCRNKHCPAKIKEEILNFVQKIGIDDLSNKRIEELIKREIITSIDSLYELSFEKLMSVDKVKDKLANKIITSIEKSKSADLITFLSALGLSGGAYNKCEKIVLNGYNTIEKVLGLTEEKLTKIESFAEKSAKDFLKSLKSKESLVIKLKGYGFSLNSNIAIVKDSPILGQKICITGTLTMKRSELQKLIKSNGGIVQTGVNKDTNLLVTNDTESTSSKFKKAKSLGTKIISENEFLKMVQ